MTTTHCHIYIYYFWDFPGGLDGKESAYNAGDLSIFGCAGSSLLHMGFLWLRRAGATL